MMNRDSNNGSNPANGVFGILVGAIFVGIGIFVVIPTFGAFGIFWTLFAVLITGFNAYRAFASTGDSVNETRPVIPPPGLNELRDEETSPEERLRLLERLKAQGLVEEDEYQWKRDEIIREL